MHPVHDIEVPADIAAFVPTVIEIARGSHHKYEVDKPTGMLRLDRVLYSAVHYPANYGFIPRTHADDNVAVAAIEALGGHSKVGAELQPQALNDRQQHG